MDVCSRVADFLQSFFQKKNDKPSPLGGEIQCDCPCEKDCQCSSVYDCASECDCECKKKSLGFSDISVKVNEILEVFEEVKDEDHGGDEDEDDEDEDDEDDEDEYDDDKTCI